MSVKISSVLKMFEVLRQAVEVVERVRTSDPVRKDAQNRTVCRFCDAPITDMNGQPSVIHEADCPFDRAQSIL